MRSLAILSWIPRREIGAFGLLIGSMILWRHFLQACAVDLVHAHTLFAAVDGFPSHLSSLKKRKGEAMFTRLLVSACGMRAHATFHIRSVRY